MADQTNRQARDELQQTRNTAIDRIQSGASEYLSSTAQAIRLGSNHMRHDGYRGSADALENAARAIQELSGEFSSQDLTAVGAKVVASTRRRPAVTLGILLGTGFVLAFAMRKPPTH